MRGGGGLAVMSGPLLSGMQLSLRDCLLLPPVLPRQEMLFWRLAACSRPQIALTVNTQALGRPDRACYGKFSPTGLLSLLQLSLPLFWELGLTGRRGSSPNSESIVAMSLYCCSDESERVSRSSRKRLSHGWPVACSSVAGLHALGEHVR